eukprot:UN00214
MDHQIDIMKNYRCGLIHLPFCTTNEEDTKILTYLVIRYPH